MQPRITIAVDLAQEPAASLQGDRVDDDVKEHLVKSGEHENGTGPADRPALQGDQVPAGCLEGRNGQESHRVAAIREENVGKRIEERDPRHPELLVFRRIDIVIPAVRKPRIDGTEFRQKSDQIADDSEAERLFPSQMGHRGQEVERKKSEHVGPHCNRSYRDIQNIVHTTLPQTNEGRSRSPAPFPEIILDP